jgi:hypothetical protein
MIVGKLISAHARRASVVILNWIRKLGERETDLQAMESQRFWNDN